MRTSRRAFLQAALAGGALSLLPAPVLEWSRAAARTGEAAGPGYFLDPTRWATGAAICARLVPTGSDPAQQPGATEARAVVFIDRYLSAFELPASVADGPAIWLRGRFSGRNPEPDPTRGRPSASRPADDMLSATGRAHFLPLSRAQILTWRASLYGPETLGPATRGTAAAAWSAQVRDGLIPGPPPGGQRRIYAEGLDAFDAWSRSEYAKPFAQASPQQQDLLLEQAGEPLAGGVAQAPLPSPPTAPAAAVSLFPLILVHTFQACYGLPEYAWSHQNPLWASIGYDGDTQPLGSTIYDADLPGAGVGQGPNAGFGMPGVYQPRGGYVEYRPVSRLDPAAAAPMTAAEERRWVPVILRVLRARGARP